jgi:broad specificity phosphatase PhoE
VASCSTPSRVRLPWELRQRKSPIAGFRPQGATAGVEILDELREVNRIVFEKAAPDEAAAFRDWLHGAAKEAGEGGGFMGFRAERVSEGEQRMLDTLAEVLSAS